MSTERYKIKVTTDSGIQVYWVKGGKLHTLTRELAEIWVKNFKPSIYRVTARGEFTTPSSGIESFPIDRVEMELATEPETP